MVGNSEGAYGRTGSLTNLLWRGLKKPCRVLSADAILRWDCYHLERLCRGWTERSMQTTSAPMASLSFSKFGPDSKTARATSFCGATRCAASDLAAVWLIHSPGRIHGRLLRRQDKDSSSLAASVGNPPEARQRRCRSRGLERHPSRYVSSWSYKSIELVLMSFPAMPSPCSIQSTVDICWSRRLVRRILVHYRIFSRSKKT